MSDTLWLEEKKELLIGVIQREVVDIDIQLKFYDLLSMDTPETVALATEFVEQLHKESFPMMGEGIYG